MKRTEDGLYPALFLRSSVLGGQVVAEIDYVSGSWQWWRGYVYAGSQLLAVQQGGVYWVHEDPVTKSKRVTNSAGAVVSTIELDPWGADTNRSSNVAFQPKKFTSYERDGNGSDEAMFRRYNRWQSRFDQPDPYDGSYDATDPQSFNRYAYVQGDPVNFVDPSGLKGQLAVACPPGWQCISTTTWDTSNQSFWQFVILSMLGHRGGGMGGDPGGGGGGGGAVGDKGDGPPTNPEGKVKSPFCGVNPITGSSGFSRNPVGAMGHLRQPVGGQGQFHASRGARVHQGLDIAAPLGTTVLAFRDGIVEAVGWGGADAGNRVRLNNGNGVVSRYAHLQNGSIPPWLTVGAAINRGEYLGSVGNTGNARNTPPHLHFGVSLHGINQDPEAFLNSPCP